MKVTPWRVVVTTFLAYETVAVLSKRRVPMVTDIMRELPRPARLVALLVVSAVVHDHLHPNGRYFR